MDKQTQDLMFKNTGDDRSTPQDFYEMLNKEFKFTLDPCASHENHKCEKYFTEEENGLEQSWKGECVFVNYPYSQAKLWLQKCFEEAQEYSTCVVVLMPARTDTKVWHEFVMKAQEVHFVKGRLKFNGEKNCAPFPSVVVVFDGPSDGKGPNFYSMERP